MREIRRKPAIHVVEFLGLPIPRQRHGIREDQVLHLTARELVGTDVGNRDIVVVAVVGPRESLEVRDRRVERIGGVDHRGLVREVVVPHAGVHEQRVGEQVGHHHQAEACGDPTPVATSVGN